MRLNKKMKIASSDLHTGIGNYLIEQDLQKHRKIFFMQCIPKLFQPLLQILANAKGLSAVKKQQTTLIEEKKYTKRSFPHKFRVSRKLAKKEKSFKKLIRSKVSEGQGLHCQFRRWSLNFLQRRKRRNQESITVVKTFG